MAESQHKPFFKLIPEWKCGKTPGYVTTVPPQSAVKPDFSLFTYINSYNRHTIYALENTYFQYFCVPCEKQYWVQKGYFYEQKAFSVWLHFMGVVTLPLLYVWLSSASTFLEFTTSWPGGTIRWKDRNSSLK